MKKLLLFKIISSVNYAPKKPNINAHAHVKLTVLVQPIFSVLLMGTIAKFVAS